MKKLIILISVLLIAISFAGFAEQLSTEKLYNPREELEYGYHAMLERQEAQNQKIQLQQYQQQQYLQEQQLLNQKKHVQHVSSKCK